MFGKKINFNVVFDKEATSLYADPPTEDKYYDAVRTVWLKELEQDHEGIIVGQTWKCDGDYYKSSSCGDEYEPACLVTTKRWPFWVVYSDMNEQYLVPKNPMPERIVIWDIDEWGGLYPRKAGDAE